MLQPRGPVAFQKTPQQDVNISVASKPPGIGSVPITAEEISVSKQICLIQGKDISKPYV